MSNSNKTAIQTTDRHNLVIAGFKKAEAECPADEVFDEVLAAIPGLTLQDLNDHLVVDWLWRHYATLTRH
jgi:hypothetical protein